MLRLSSKYKIDQMNKISLILLILIASSCASIKKTWNNANLFPVSEDIKLCEQVYQEIISNTAEFPIVPESGNEEVYSYVRGITKKILNTGNVKYATEFPWKVTLINDSKTQNAFATPGGYIFVYTGLMKFLDSEDQLAGVMGHEIAHAANRHSTRQLTKIMGASILLDAVLGKKETVKEVTTAIVGLSFSRDHETEADSFSVKYLCGTNYNAAGAAGFFKKIQGQATPPEWISTHPNPTNRVKNIESKAIALSCRGKETYKAKYDQIKSLINKIPPAPPAPKSTLPKNQNTGSSGSTTKTGSDPMNKPTPPPSTGTGSGKKTGGKIEKPN